MLQGNHEGGIFRVYTRGVDKPRVHIKKGDGGTKVESLGVESNSAEFLNVKV